MAELPESVANFLSGRRFAVAGVSRDAKGHVGNAIFKKLKDSGREVFALNPNATDVEGVPCYADVTAIPGEIDGVVICTAPGAALSVVQKCAEKGVKNVWFHRAFGQGSASDDAIAKAKSLGMSVIENGCPMMYVEPVDGGHKFICRLLTFFRKAPR